MLLFKKSKDGGPESTVTGYWLIEIKSLFTIVLLKFEGKSREAFHTHAFNCINWLIKGQLFETLRMHGEDIQYRYPRTRYYKPSIIPFIIRRRDFHKVDSDGVSWVLSIRGPWSKTWKEYRPLEGREVVLTSGRLEQ